MNTELEGQELEAAVAQIADRIRSAADNGSLTLVLDRHAEPHVRDLVRVVLSEFLTLICDYLVETVLVRVVGDAIVPVAGVVRAGDATAWHEEEAADLLVDEVAGVVEDAVAGVVAHAVGAEVGNFMRGCVRGALREKLVEAICPVAAAGAWTGCDDGE